MHHEIRFIDGNTVKNTWSDWGLMAMRQPTFVPPPVKRKILELPGGNGEIDLSEAVTGYPLFANREGSWSFLTPKRSEDFWPIYDQIMKFLHGQRMQAVLPDDDPGWYSEGRFWVDTMACDRLHGVITIGYSVGPFLWSRESTAEPWLWDPFSFETGVIGNGTFSASFSASEDVTTTPTELAYTATQTGIAFFFPSFTVTGDNDVTLEIKAGDETRATVTLAHGATASVPRLALTEGRWLYRLEPVQVYASTASGTAALAVNAYVSIQNAGMFNSIEVTDEPMTLDFSADYPDAGVWPLDAAGDAPVQVAFASGGGLADVTMTLKQGASVIAEIPLYNGSTTTVPGLVLYRGTWLYNGQAVTMELATESGTATLAVQFRRGKL